MLQFTGTRKAEKSHPLNQWVCNKIGKKVITADI
jgi:hypothetical protein